MSFRNPKLIEKTNFARFDLNTPLTFPANNQHQTKTGYKFAVNDRSNWYDWYNAYFRVNYTLEATADGVGLAAATTSSTINGSFSLLNKLTVKSNGKTIYNVSDVHKVIFIKNLLDFSDDYSRSAAKSQFWYLDTAESVVLADNSGIHARQLLTRRIGEGGGGENAAKVVETIIPLNRFGFFEELSDKILPPMNLDFEITLQSDPELIWQNDGTDRRVVVRTFELWVPIIKFTSEGQTLLNSTFLKPRKIKFKNEELALSTARRDPNGAWQISAGKKNVKHVFMFLQQTRKTNSLGHNPYIFDTFDIDGNNSAKLSTCRLQYGPAEYYPELDYDETFKLRILEDLINYSYRKNDYNTGVQLQSANFETLFPIIYFDLRENKNNLTNESKQLVFHYRLNEAANAQNYTIFAAILYEEEIVLDIVGGELVVV